MERCNVLNAINYKLQVLAAYGKKAGLTSGTFQS
jgi:hypothetical protein